MSQDDTERLGQAGADGPSAGLGGPAHPAPTAVASDVDPEGDPSRSTWRRTVLVGCVAIAVLALSYVLDLTTSGANLPRGVTVAGVEVGGLDRPTAEQRLRAQLGPRLAQPVVVRVDGMSSSLDPRSAGLSPDWAGTLDRAGQQPVDSWTRLRSLFTSREIGMATRVDTAALSGALLGLQHAVERAPVEGGIRFAGARPVPVPPVGGRTLDVPGAVDTVAREWAFGRPVELPVSSIPVSVTRDGVNSALTELAQPAVAGPVTVQGEGKQATLSPEQIAAALSFAPDGQGGLTPRLDNRTITRALEPQLASTEQPGRDATISVTIGAPVTTPSLDGRGIDYDATLAGLLDVLRRTDNRTITAGYAPQPAQLSTEQANGLGINEVIGEFTTGGFATDSGMNIRRVAGQVDGAIIRPGRTFSLNGYTGARDAAQGYVDAGIIEDGRPARGIGGGISQFATTLYNASYFAGMVDVEHTEHSYYISRYPVAREATVFEGQIDLRFRDEGPSGVLIQTVWSPSSITVRLWGTRRYEVSSSTGPRTAVTPASTKTVPATPDCKPTRGVAGFTATNTRTLRELSTGRVRQEPRTVTYHPEPRIVCRGSATGG